MITLFKKGSVFLVGMLLISASYAETAVCKGKITQLANHTPGAVHVIIGDSNIIRICNPEEIFLRTTPENCKHIYSMAAMAFAMDKEVVLYVDNAPTTRCADIPSWFKADMRYFAITK